MSFPGGGIPAATGSGPWAPSDLPFPGGTPPWLRARTRGAAGYSPSSRLGLPARRPAPSGPAEAARLPAPSRGALCGTPEARAAGGGPAPPRQVIQPRPAARPPALPARRPGTAEGQPAAASPPRGRGRLPAAGRWCRRPGVPCSPPSSPPGWPPRAGERGRRGRGGEGGGSRGRAAPRSCVEGPGLGPAPRVAGPGRAAAGQWPC